MSGFLFSKGLLDHVTVLIGVAVGDKAIAGVIHQPYYNYKAPPGSVLGRTIWGIVGLGGFGFKHISPPEDKRIITTTRSHGTAAVQAALDAMKPDDVLRVGGAGHKVSCLPFSVTLMLCNKSVNFGVLRSYCFWKAELMLMCLLVRAARSGIRVHQKLSYIVLMAN